MLLLLALVVRTMVSQNDVQDVRPDFVEAPAGSAPVTSLEAS
jgi:hypothetical protein